MTKELGIGKLDVEGQRGHKPCWDPGRRGLLLGLLRRCALPDNEVILVLARAPALEEERFQRLVAHLEAKAGRCPSGARRGVAVEVLEELAGYQREYGDAVDVEGYPSPRGLVRYADRRVVGQRAAKEDLALAFYLHAKGLRAPGLARAARSFAGPLLSHGPTGSGKSLLHRVMAEASGLPFLATNCAGMVGEGIVGESLSGCLLGHLERHGGSEEAVRGSVIFFDEVDKLFVAGGVYGEGVASQLLMVLEGGEVALPRRGANQEATGTQRLSTESFLVCMAGAFQVLQETRRAGRGGAVGFHGAWEKAGEKWWGEEMVGAGVPRELVGRVRGLVGFDALGEEELVSILRMEHEGSPVYAAGLLLGGGGLGLEDRDLRELAREAAAKGTGARGLTALVRELVRERLC